jgi:hypothetical protein
MDVNKITEGMALLNTVGRMKKVEESLREAAEKYICLHIKFRVKGIDEAVYLDRVRGDAYVIKRMIETGITVAMTIRAQAENDLQKL